MTVMITIKMTPTTMMMTPSKAMLPIMRGDSRRQWEGGRGSHSACFRNPACEAFTVGTKREQPTHPLGHLATLELSHTCTSRKIVANSNISRNTNTDTVANRNTNTDTGGNRNTNTNTYFATKPPWP